MAKVALLIGVSRCESGLKPLPGAEGDAEAMRRVLQHPEMGGFDDAQLLINPSRQQMEEAIYALCADRRRDDLVLLYFSGHGIQAENGRLYLTTQTTRKGNQGELVKPTAVAASFIQDIFNSSHARQQIIVLDCCFSANSASSVEDSVVNIQTQLGGANQIILTSSSSMDYSLEQKQSNLSLYTRYLVEGIETGVASQDNDGRITIDELYDYTKKRVQAAAPAIKPEIYTAKPDDEIVLSKTPTGDPKLSYHRYVEDRLQAGQIEILSFDRLILDWRRDKLGLSPETALTVEKLVLEPYIEYQNKLQRFEQKLTEIIDYDYPLKQTTLRSLERFCQRLGLRKEDVSAIAAQTTTQLEEDYQQNLRQYEQNFIHEIRAGYPLNRDVRNELRYLEQKLNLRPQDVSSIKRRIITQREERYQQNLQQYERNFSHAIYMGYPLSEHIRRDLKLFQQSCNLNNEDVALIQERVLAQLFLSKEEYPERLQRYRQVLTDAIRSEYPLSHCTWEGLEIFRNSLDIKDEDAERIEEKVVAQFAPKREAYQQKLQQYQQLFTTKVQPSQPFSDYTLYELAACQHVLGLKDEDVVQVEEQIIQQKSEEYQQKLQQYEQEFSFTVQSEFPLIHSRDRLKQLQQSLNLTKTDTELVERIALNTLDLDALNVEHPEEAVRQNQEPVQPEQTLSASPDPTFENQPDPTFENQSEQSVNDTTAPAQANRNSEADANPENQPPSSTDELITSVQPGSDLIQPDLDSKDQPVPSFPKSKARSPFELRDAIEKMLNPEFFKLFLLAALVAIVGRVLVTFIMTFLSTIPGQIIGVVVFVLTIVLAWEILKSQK